MLCARGDFPIKIKSNSLNEIFVSKVCTTCETGDMLKKQSMLKYQTTKLDRFLKHLSHVFGEMTFNISFLTIILPLHFQLTFL